MFHVWFSVKLALDYHKLVIWTCGIDIRFSDKNMTVQILITYINFILYLEIYNFLLIYMISSFFFFAFLVSPVIFEYHIKTKITANNKFTGSVRTWRSARIMFTSVKAIILHNLEKLSKSKQN